MKGRYVLSSYNKIEKDLKQVLHVIPYCEEHKKVWSPLLGNIILQSCILLDSLWYYQAQQSPCVTKEKLYISDYFSYFGEYIAQKWVVFWGEEVEQVHPYVKWRKPSYSIKNYEKLYWWETYTHLKHDLLNNIIEATFQTSVRALSGLFLAILQSELCRDAIGEDGWLSADRVAHLGEDWAGIKGLFLVVESKLFSYPVGWCEEKIEKREEWNGPSSSRFKRWFDEYESPA